MYIARMGYNKSIVIFQLDSAMKSCNGKTVSYFIAESLTWFIYNPHDNVFLNIQPHWI